MMSSSHFNRPWREYRRGMKPNKSGDLKECTHYVCFRDILHDAAGTSNTVDKNTRARVEERIVHHVVGSLRLPFVALDDYLLP